MNDIRSALRQLLRNPGFTAMSVLVLAIGIGVNSVMFSMVDAVLFRPLPVDRPLGLVRIGMTDAAGRGLGGVAYPFLNDLARDARALSGLAGVSDGSEVNLSVGDAAVERVNLAAVGGAFFEILGVQPLAGRLFSRADDMTPGAHPVMILSEAFWRRRFASDDRIVGSAVRMNTHVFSVVGIAPRGFQGVNLESVPDVWVPLTMAEQVSPNIAQFKPFQRRGFTWVDIVARLAPAATEAAAVAELDTINARINRELKISTEGDRYDRFAALPLSRALFDPTRQIEVSRSSWILTGVTGLVLVIACAVAAGLLLVRGEQRQRELAVRMAIGASRARLLRQLLTEGFLLSLAAAAAGLLLANWTAGLFAAFAPTAFPLPLAASTPVFETRVVWFAIALGLTSALGAALLPAFRLSRASVVETMRRDHAGGREGLGRWSLRNAFVVVQVALSVVLLIGAMLLLRTLREESRIALGFDSGNALVVTLDVSKSGYDRERGKQFYARLMEEVRAMPGVRSAALSRHVPVQGAAMITTVTLSSVPRIEGREPEVAFTPVSPDFFRTLGLKIEQGRDFSRTDASGPSIVAVNRAFADRFWPGRDALRERVLNFGEKGAEVVAVVADAKQTSLRESGEPMLYVPDSGYYMPRTSLVVRTVASPRALLPALKALIGRLDRNVPLLQARTLDEHVGLAMAEERATAALLSAFGLLALALAAVGLYGVIAYTTELRAKEFGIRVAVGASPRALLILVVRQGAGLAGVGIAIGLLAATGATRALGSMLYGVSPTDALSFTITGVVMWGVALLASAVPARRAARIDPMRTLRAE
jgi:putative ABC transport system permease protein